MPALVWRKLASAKWEDAWVERLRFLGPERLAITAFAGAKTIRLEAYALSKKEGAALVKKFGGQLRTAKRTATYKAERRAPIYIRQSLIVVTSDAEKRSASKQFPERKILVVPAAMAFGTGDHATTAQCLRFLCDAARELKSVDWEMLDLGTGSGILAMAARALGARRAGAFDFDSDAVRTARENARINGIDSLAIRKLDVTKWTPRRRWDVVAANLYSEVLMAASAAIVHALKPAGLLLVSGILRAQERECIAAFRHQGLRLEKTARRGKWVTLFWRARRV